MEFYHPKKSLKAQVSKKNIVMFKKFFEKLIYDTDYMVQMCAF
jgi:hypothetical protein